VASRTNSLKRVAQKGYKMSVQKKSLISNRLTVKEALIANQPESEQENPLKANSLTAQSMRRMKANNALRFKSLKTAANFQSFKAAK
jgi:hypothetical protein